jgi:hypothetical protein
MTATVAGREPLALIRNVGFWHSLPVAGLSARMSVGEGTAAVARPPGARGKVTPSRHHWCSAAASRGAMPEIICKSNLAFVHEAFE